MSWRSMYRLLLRLKLPHQCIRTICHHRPTLQEKSPVVSNIKLFTGFYLGFSIISDNTKDIGDDDVKHALEKGGTAIIEMMDQLTILVVQVSKEYRDCITKQIEITMRATEMGPLSPVWDELPEYRTLADQLNGQLNEYIAIFKVIGELTYDTTLIAVTVGRDVDKKELEVVGTKFKDLEVLMLTEFEKNKTKEIELLKVTRNSILRGGGG